PMPPEQGALPMSTRIARTHPSAVEHASSLRPVFRSRRSEARASWRPRHTDESRPHGTGHLRQQENKNDDQQQCAETDVHRALLTVSQKPRPYAMTCGRTNRASPSGMSTIRGASPLRVRAPNRQPSPMAASTKQRNALRQMKKLPRVSN